jgi:hypothetical protein
MNDLNDDPNVQTSGDVNLEVVGTGCGTSCGLGCLSALILISIGVVLGVPTVTRNAGSFALLGLLMGGLTHIFVGYVTARAARAKKLPVNLHIFIIGGLQMILGVLNRVIQIRPGSSASLPSSSMLGLSLFSILIVIPLMLLGASIQKGDRE